MHICRVIRPNRFQIKIYKINARRNFADPPQPLWSFNPRKLLSAELPILTLNNTEYSIHRLV
jgi:hypothetical protein